jgi:dephospho-CoA kinase
MPGSGKGECAKLAREQGLTVINMGDLIREHTVNSNLELIDENIGKTAHSEREKFGYDIWAKRTMEKIKTMNMPENDMIVIDGIRGDSEIAVFLDAFGDDFCSIAVKMSADKRFELLKQRKRNDAPMTRQEFDTRDAREAKWGLKKALENADYIIYNNGTISDLNDSFTELLNVINKQILS